MSMLQFGEGTTPKEICDPDRPCPFVDAESAPPSHRRRWITFGSLFLVVLVVILFNPFMGGTSGHHNSNGLIGGWGYCVGFGSRTIFGRAGQQLTLSYTTTIKSGHIQIGIWPSHLVPRLETPLRRIHVDRTKSASVVVTLPETGFYRIAIDSCRGDRTYDVEYDVFWRVH